MELTLALERYDRHVPFFDGTVQQPSGFTLRTLQVGQTHSLPHGARRHDRMLAGEFDIAEFSASTFLMAIDRGLPIIGIPVFPRRLFTAGLIYVRGDSDISEISALKGRRVAIRSFQTTLSLLAKGDLKYVYDTPWEEIEWLLQEKEKIGFSPKPGVKIATLPEGTDVGHLLRDGGCDAIIEPIPPRSISSGQVGARRLFRDYQSVELRYFEKRGFWPIMHVVAMRTDLAKRHPSLPRDLVACFRHARDLAWDYYSDPNWSSLAWGRGYFEREREAFGADPWTFGVAANRSNMDQLAMYSLDQGLVSRRLSIDEMFHSSVLDS